MGTLPSAHQVYDKVTVTMEVIAVRFAGDRVYYDLAFDDGSVCEDVDSSFVQPVVKGE